MADRNNPFNLEGNAEYDFVRMPKELVDKVLEVTDIKQKEKLYFEAIEHKKRDIKNEIECLEEDMLLFKAFGMRYKRELEEAYQKQSEVIEKLWTDFNASDHIYNKIKPIKEQISYISDSVKEIERKIKYADVSRLEKACDVIERFNRMSVEDKQILKQMFLKEDE